MKNKVLTEIYVPQLDEEYDIYLPLNKNIANIIELVCKSLTEMKRIEKIDFNNYSLYNRENGTKYLPNKTIIETDIRNGVRLIMM